MSTPVILFIYELHLQPEFEHYFVLCSIFTFSSGPFHSTIFVHHITKLTKTSHLTDYAWSVKVDLNSIQGLLVSHMTTHYEFVRNRHNSFSVGCRQQNLFNPFALGYLGIPTSLKYNSIC